MANVASTKRKKITLQCDREEGRDIFVAGSFNEWAVNPADKKAKIKLLKENKKHPGKYTVSMFLAPGEYEYKFFSNGEWFTDSNADVHKQNSFGTFNSVLSVG